MTESSGKGNLESSVKSSLDLLIPHWLPASPFLDLWLFLGFPLVGFHFPLFSFFPSFYLTFLWTEAALDLTVTGQRFNPISRFRDPEPVLNTPADLPLSLPCPIPWVLTSVPLTSGEFWGEVGGQKPREPGIFIFLAASIRRISRMSCLVVLPIQPSYSSFQNSPLSMPHIPELRCSLTRTYPFENGLFLKLSSNYPNLSMSFVSCQGKINGKLVHSSDSWVPTAEILNGKEVQRGIYIFNKGPLLMPAVQGGLWERLDQTQSNWTSSRFSQMVRITQPP